MSELYIYNDDEITVLDDNLNDVILSNQKKDYKTVLEKTAENTYSKPDVYKNINDKSCNLTPKIKKDT